MNDTEQMPLIFNSNCTTIHIDEAADVFNKYFFNFNCWIEVRLYGHWFCCVVPKELFYREFSK